MTYFFLGIGGIGMSALAQYLKLQGYNVIGYDAAETQITQQLQRQGIDVFYQDSVDLLPPYLTPDNTVVVRTPAIKQGKLLSFFLQNGFEIIKRGELLAQVTNDDKQIAIAGTHGKTTTTAMVTHILKQAGKLKVGFIGGVTKNYASNLVLGQGPYAVVEADEYDYAFLSLKPDLAVVTSLEADHLDIYKNEQNLRKNFELFLSRIKPSGLRLANLKTDLSDVEYHYSVTEPADFYVTDVRHQDRKQYFTLNLLGEQLETYINFPGQAYLEDALAAAATAFLAGTTPEQIKSGLQTYLGTERRFDLKFQKYGKYIYEDYAHHPTEIEALYQAARLFFPDKRLAIAFQPHLYSRTRHFAEQFGRALSKFDLVVVTDIYPAREQPIQGVDPYLILTYVQSPNKIYIPFNYLADFLVQTNFEVLFVTGAGNINQIVKPLIQKLTQIYEN